MLLIPAKWTQEWSLLEAPLTSVPLAVPEGGGRMYRRYHNIKHTAVPRDIYSSSWSFCGTTQPVFVGVLIRDADVTQGRSNQPKDVAPSETQCPEQQAFVYKRHVEINNESRKTEAQRSIFIFIFESQSQ